MPAGQKAKMGASKTAKKQPPRARRESAARAAPRQAKPKAAKLAADAPNSSTATREEKYVLLKLERDPAMEYYVKTAGPRGKDGADVCAKPRAELGAAKPAPVRITSLGFHVDWDKFIYFLDEDGDVSRVPRRWKRNATNNKTEG